MNMAANTHAFMKGKWHPNVASSQGGVPAVHHGPPSRTLRYIAHFVCFQSGGPRGQALLQLLYPSTANVPDVGN